jgi:hypothetical protein
MNLDRNTKIENIGTECLEERFSRKIKRNVWKQFYLAKDESKLMVIVNIKNAAMGDEFLNELNPIRPIVFGNITPNFSTYSLNPELQQDKLNNAKRQAQRALDAGNLRKRLQKLEQESEFVINCLQ